MSTMYIFTYTNEYIKHIADVKYKWIGHFWDRNASIKSDEKKSSLKIRYKTQVVAIFTTGFDGNFFFYPAIYPQYILVLKYTACPPKKAEQQIFSTLQAKNVIFVYIIR